MYRHILQVLIGLLVAAAPAGVGASQASGTQRSTNVDRRVQAAIEGVTNREQRLREISVTYDYDIVWTEDTRQTGLQGQSSQTEPSHGTQKSRITWACKGRKMLFDETFVRIGDHKPFRRRQIYDGEKMLSDRYDDLQKATPSSAVVSHADEGTARKTIGRGAQAIGLIVDYEPLAKQLKSAARIRCLGYETVDRNQCLVLDVQAADVFPKRTELWLDVKHGFLLRKARQYLEGKLAAEVIASTPRQWCPAVFLSPKVVKRLFSDGVGANPGSIVAVQTATLRKVAIGSLPDRLFDATPREGTHAYDARTGALFGQLPRRAVEGDLDALLQTAQSLLRGKPEPQRFPSANAAPVVPARGPDCGPQSLYIICRSLGVRTNLAELRRLSQTADKGTSLQGLLAAAQSKGLSVRGLQLPFAALRQLKQPIIAVRPNHFYVFYGFRRGGAILVDPPDEVYVAPEAKFRQNWDGRVLLVENSKS